MDFSPAVTEVKKKGRYPWKSSRARSFLSYIIVIGAVVVGIPVCFADNGDYGPGAPFRLVLDDAVAENNLPRIAVSVSFNGGCGWYGASGLVEVYAFDTEAQYYAWASVVDNRSGGPVVTPAQSPTEERP